jgi:hypothetical protein
MPAASTSNYRPWVASSAAVRRYFQVVAECRFVLRKVFRIVDDQVRRHGLEPLPHQALIQVLGSPTGGLSIAVPYRRAAARRCASIALVSSRSCLRMAVSASTVTMLGCTSRMPPLTIIPLKSRSDRVPVQRRATQ